MKRSEFGKKESGRSAPTKEPEPRSFPIVGVGASAGGLEAFSELLRHLPVKTGMAFVLVQHLDPGHGSALPEILSRTTKIPVEEVTDGVIIQRDHAYVIPPNTVMGIQNGALQLGARVLVRGQHLPIDYFLRSLAEDQGDRAIAVILSGTASDGAEGCRAIKAAGGITFAQDQESAKYGSMPRSAAAAGCIDFILPPQAIAVELATVGRHPYIMHVSAEKQEPLAVEGSTELATILALLRKTTGVDFTHYKQTTLQRRIKRRMVLHKVARLEEYVHYLKNTPDESQKLYRDILIHVTGFFRDPESFQALQQSVFPRIFQDRKGDGPVRIWVPGCSSGEEAYSIAITFLEYLLEHRHDGTLAAVDEKALQLFATDISEVSLDRARAGLYADSIAAQVSPELLKRFFVQRDGGYQISKSIRERCIFARQNVAKDPPFSNLDLISCRNLLIYLGPVLQNRVIPVFHYALKPSGFLMLGNSESLGTFSEHFGLVDKKHKIYQKKKTATRLATHFAGKRKTAQSTISVTASGMSPNCVNCWKTLFPITRAW